MKKREFTEQQKRVAVLALDHKSATEVAKELKCVPSMIYTWRKNIAAFGAPSKRRGQQPVDSGGDRLKDATIYLQHAERRIMAAVRSGAKRISASDLHALLALATLRGEI